MIRYFISIVYLISIFICHSCTAIENADLVIKVGKVVTVDQEFSYAEAVAVKDGKIIFVGSKNDANWFIDEATDLIELDGGLVLPGLIDAHGHLTGYGESLEYINLVGTTSFEEILNLVQDKLNASKPGEWIRGRGWDQNDWDNHDFPSHQLLTRLAPNNPVVLTRIDGHALLANQKAMEIAGIDNQIVDPSGGKILRDDHGNPTGIFIDNAESLITNHIPSYSRNEIREQIKNSAQHLAKYGITGIHDAGVSPYRIEDYKYLIDNSEMPVRINAMLSDTLVANINDYLVTQSIDSYQNDMLRVKSIKIYADGALGSRGAALFEPYSDDPDNKGLFLTDSLHIYEMSVASLNNGFQVCTHAIGDRAINMMLNIYSDALQEISVNDHRFRIEHSQIVDLDDVERYVEIGVIPAMQPQHAISDMPWVEDRIGVERMERAYPWRSFVDEGSIIPFGSDVPVEIPDPMLGIYNAITRQDVAGFPKGGWIPNQKMTIEEAIRGYTIWAAQAAFQEDIIGSIEIGKYADFTIIDTDITQSDPSELLNVEILYTIVTGEIQYNSYNIETTI